MFWNDGALRVKLVERGHARLPLWTKEDFNRTIKKTIDDFEKEKQHTG